MFLPEKCRKLPNLFQFLKNLGQVEQNFNHRWSDPIRQNLVTYSCCAAFFHPRLLDVVEEENNWNQRNRSKYNVLSTSGCVFTSNFKNGFHGHGRKRWCPKDLENRRVLC